MSAGIFIMNKNAIAMAADSAVTIGEHKAIHNSANKVFALSKVAPVGVITYANASFMGVPIEVILKEYKKDLGNTKLISLKNYVESFLDFILKKRDLFRFDKTEAQYVKDTYENLLNGTATDLRIFMETEVKNKGKALSDNDILKILKSAVQTTVSLVANLKKTNDFCFSQYIKNKYSSEICKSISNRFPNILEEDLRLLQEACCDVFDSTFMRNGFTGLAFAGYGEEEIYPQMVHIQLSGILNGTCRFIEVESTTIDEETQASVIPLAQTDVMKEFILGIHESFLSSIQNGINEGITNFDSSALDRTTKFHLSNSINNSVNSNIEKCIRNHSYPLLGSVATLPIEEMALLAESMINITSLRRRVAIDDNIGTVGGPIDVGIISKADGVIWIKRKHYFDKEYNPQYFYSHYSANNSTI